MNIQTFTDEANRLSRPCEFLPRNGAGKPSEFWHGTSPGLCVSLADHDKWLNVFLHDDCINGNVEITAMPTTSNIPLYATTGISLPPVDAVFLLEGKAISEFLAKHNWAQEEPFNNNFPDGVPSEYNRKWQSNCPLYQSDISMMRGGWNMPWPSGDWYDHVNDQLVAWTFRDSEPWVEVFERAGEYIVKQRIT